MKETTKKAIEEAETALKTNPKAKGFKIKQPDYDKIDDLTLSTAKKLSKVKNKDQAHRIMNTYLTEYDKLLLNSAFVTVGLGAIIYRLKKKNDTLMKANETLITSIARVHNDFTFRDYDNLTDTLKKQFSVLAKNLEKSATEDIRWTMAKITGGLWRNGDQIDNLKK